MKNLTDYYWEIVDRGQAQKDPAYISRAAAALSRITGSCQEMLFEQAVDMAMAQNNLDCAIRTLEAWGRARRG